MKPTLSVHLVTWNGEKYIPYLFDSLRRQQYQDWKLYIWDNASSDDTVAYIKQELQEFPVPVELIEHDTNSGFAGGHNALYQHSSSEYILLLNQDMYIEEDCFKELINYIQQEPDVAAVSARLMRWDFAAVEDNRLEESFTEYIDSLGLKVFRNRRVIEQYSQEWWSAESTNPIMLELQKERVLPVFGVSGALPMFRREAIKDIALNNELLDTSYHSYKEDVDLAFRLQSAGYGARIVLSAIAYHDRSAAGPRELNDATAMKNKKNQSDWVRYHSYKNHLFTLYKNEYAQNVLLDFFPIFWYEIKKFIYFLFFDRTVLKGLKEVWHHRKEMKHKRLFIQQKRRVSYKDMRRWWR